MVFKVRIYFKKSSSVPIDAKDYWHLYKATTMMVVIITQVIHIPRI